MKESRACFSTPSFLKLVLEAIEIGADPIAVDVARVGQKLIDGGGARDGFIAGDGQFHSIAGGENHALGKAGAALQFLESGSNGLFGVGDFFANLHGRALMIQACDGELHHFASKERRPTWAAQVNAEQHITAMAIRAAFRPRQPALARKNTIVK